METKDRFIYKLIFGFFVINLFLTNVSFAKSLSDWNDPLAYRPNPVLFLHGFASGGPETWTEAKVDEGIKQYYSKYYAGYNSDPTILQFTRYPYLEIVDFGATLIDRNSSIDTYKLGDRYVLTGERNAGDLGWADKISNAIETLRQYYKNRDDSTQKIILVGHSMGGLAARKYLKSFSYADQKIEKLIMIGVPNLGSLLSATTTTAPYNRNRRWGWSFSPSGWVSLTSEGIVDIFLETFPRIDIHGDAVWDMDPTKTGSGFIAELNNEYLHQIDHFVIAGKHWLSFNQGDGIVSLGSQLGNGILSLKGSRVILASHWTEPAISVSGDNPLLKFLDSAKPEFKITSPNSNGTTELSGSSVHIQGKVYKEYLPADSKLHLRVVRESDGVVVLDEDRLDSIKPSDLWIPNDPDSPVAEFDELITFSSKDTYKISCYIKNPAGEVSDTKNVWVKVLYEGTNIIVHCHSPEGKEINSIYHHYDNFLDLMTNQGEVLAWWRIDNGYWKVGASKIEDHNKSYPITPGVHTITASVHGITQTQTIDVKTNETAVVTFTFDREILPYSQWIDLLAGSNSGSASVDTEFEREAYSDSSLFIPGGVFIRPSTGTSKFQFNYWLKDGNGTFHLSAEGTSEEEFNSSVYRMKGTASISITPVGDANNLWGNCGIFTQFYNIKSIPYSLAGDPKRRWIIQWILPLPEGCQDGTCKRPHYPDLYVSSTFDPQYDPYCTKILGGNETEGLLVMPAEVNDGNYLVATGPSWVGGYYSSKSLDIDINKGILEDSGTIFDFTQNVTYISAASIPYDLAGDAF